MTSRDMASPGSFLASLWWVTAMRDQRIVTATTPEFAGLSVFPPTLVSQTNPELPKNSLSNWLKELFVAWSVPCSYVVRTLPETLL